MINYHGAKRCEFSPNFLVIQLINVDTENRYKQKNNIFLSRSLSWKKIIECHAVMFRSHAALFWETLCWVSDPHLLPKNPVYTLQKTNMAMENLPFLAGDASSNGCLSFAVCHVCFWGFTLSRITVGNLLRQYRRGDYPEKGASGDQKRRHGLGGLGFQYKMLNH